MSISYLETWKSPSDVLSRSVSPVVLKPNSTTTPTPHQKQRSSSMNSVSSQLAHMRSMLIVSQDSPRNSIVSVDDFFVRPPRNNSCLSLASLGVAGSPREPPKEPLGAIQRRSRKGRNGCAIFSDEEFSDPEHSAHRSVVYRRRRSSDKVHKPEFLLSFKHNFKFKYDTYAKPKGPGLNIAAASSSVPPGYSASSTNVNPAHGSTSHSNLLQSVGTSRLEDLMPSPLSQAVEGPSSHQTQHNQILQIEHDHSQHHNHHHNHHHNQHHNQHQNQHQNQHHNQYQYQYQYQQQHQTSQHQHSSIFLETEALSTAARLPVTPNSKKTRSSLMTQSMFMKRKLLLSKDIQLELLAGHASTYAAFPSGHGIHHNPQDTRPTLSLSQPSPSRSALGHNHVPLQLGEGLPPASSVSSSSSSSSSSAIKLGHTHPFKSPSPSHASVLPAPSISSSSNSVTPPAIHPPTEQTLRQQNKLITELNRKWNRAMYPPALGDFAQHELHALDFAPGRVLSKKRGRSELTSSTDSLATNYS